VHHLSKTHLICRATVVVSPTDAAAVALSVRRASIIERVSTRVGVEMSVSHLHRLACSWMLESGGSREVQVESEVRGRFLNILS